MLSLADRHDEWTSAAPGMPNVEVTSLAIVTEERILYAATHGLGHLEAEPGLTRS